MDVRILYQDQWLLAAYKPSGLLIHSYKEKCGEQDTMLRRLRDLSGHYLYPIHRLDRPVSGIVLFGLEAPVVKAIKEIWHTEDVIKEYLALCKGNIESEGQFDFPLKNDQGIAQDALTHYTPIEHFSEATLVKVNISTGRKHQIRRHLGRRSHNIIGDVKHGRGPLNKYYKKQFGLERIFLHAHRFQFKHPYTDKIVEIKEPLPLELSNILDCMRANDGIGEL